ncbi:GEVED domain-containing protein [Flavobacterium sp. 3HN19-14]|uniref:GEVED domain-containing protein n=1 Tax=Flavobacterium sp. 3HN19-14 TaxID=3448133 RepID=UPI003EE06203
MPDLTASTTSTLSVSYGPDGAQFCAVWIDYNHNGVFDASEGTLCSGDACPNGTSVINIAIPQNALSGNTKMRIRGGDDNALTTAQACGATNSVYGETEDYIVNILPAPPANNNCAGAETLTLGAFGSCLANTALGTTIGATPSAGIAKTSCDMGIYKDVFYKFNSGNNTEISLNFTNLTGVCQFGLYTACGTGFANVCSSTSYSGNIAEVIPNTTYYIVVWSNPGSEGTFALCVSQTAPCAITTNWNGSAWSAGAPNSNKGASFSSDYSYTADTTVCNITVNSGTLTVNSGYDLNVLGAITVNSPGAMILENNANLLQTEGFINTGNITVKRQANMRRLDYVYWGAPVAGQDLKLFSPYTVSPTNAPGFPTPTGASRFYTLNESTNGFVVIPNPLGVLFLPGKGYMLRAPNNFPDDGSTATFSGEYNGVPNNGNALIPITNTPGTGKGYNMLGNPYPSTISASSFLAQNPGELYFWTHTNQDAPSGANYATFTTFGTASAAGGATPNGTIAIGQGFLLKTATSGIATFTNAMRSGNNTATFFRDANTDKSRIWLNLSNETGMQNQILVGYMDSATNGIDTSIDAKQIESNINNIASLIGEDKFNIQARAMPFAVTDEIPLSFNAIAAGTFSISIDHADGLFANDQEVYLKDNVSNIIYNLSEGAYTFAAEAGTTTSRFSIVFENSTLGIGNPSLNADNLVIYNNNNVLNINSGSMEMTDVKIFDIRGRLIFEQSGINANTAALDNLKAQQEMLLVQVTLTDGEVITKKAVY